MHYVVLICTFLFSGSLYTLSIKWADQSVSCNTTEKCDTPRPFRHPIVQAVAMFFGEFLCFIGYHVWLWCCSATVGHHTSLPVRRCLLFLLPAVLDITATVCAYIGLGLTFASSFEMLKGSLVIFTALLSMAFLRRLLKCFEWSGIAVITLGLVLVGLGDYLYSHLVDSHIDATHILTGDVLIIIAQVANAAQFVVEEQFIRKYNVPSPVVVGLEGLFGTVILVVLLVPLYYIPGPAFISSDPQHFENIWDAFSQMRNNWHISLAMLGIIVNIAVFNMCGVNITKESGAVTRQVADVGRILIVWAVSLSLGWQPYSYRSILMQTAGFLLLVVGIFIYNDVVVRPLLLWCCCLPVLPILSDGVGEIQFRTPLLIADVSSSTTSEAT